MGGVTAGAGLEFDVKASVEGVDVPVDVVDVVDVPVEDVPEAEPEDEFLESLYPQNPLQLLPSLSILGTPIFSHIPNLLLVMASTTLAVRKMLRTGLSAVLSPRFCL